MDAEKAKFRKACGLIMIICASAVAVLNLALNKNTDNYIMPLILLIPGILFIIRKQSEESRQILLSPKKRKIIVTTLSLFLVAGIVTLISTFI